MELLHTLFLTFCPKPHVLSEAKEAIQRIEEAFGDTQMHHAGQYAVLGENQALQNSRYIFRTCLQILIVAGTMLLGLEEKHCSRQRSDTMPRDQ